MVNIKLDEQYRIVSDERQFVLQKYVCKRKETGEDRYKSVAYAQNVPYLIREYTYSLLRESSASSLEELVSTYRGIEERVYMMLSDLDKKLS